VTAIRPLTWEGEVWLHAPQGGAQLYERYAVTINPDGSRTLKTLTVSPNGTLVRDVHQSVSRDWQPLHGSSRVHLDGRAQGVVSKWVSPGEIHSTVHVDGDFSYERFVAPAGRFSIGFHPIADEAWKMALIDASRTGRSPLTTHTCSPTWNGRTIEHGRTVTSEVDYLGPETRDVDGVALPCHAFLWHTPFAKQLKVWAWGEHYLFAGLSVVAGDNAGTEYVLTRLRQSGWP
jgi:hypothetical protein